MSNDYQQALALPDVNSIKWWHRIPLPDGTITPGIVKHGDDLDRAWIKDRFGIPDDLTDKTVLDIGAWDGMFSFECEKRGAKHVIASDCTEKDGGHWGSTKGFDYAHAALNSKVRYIEATVDNLINHTAPKDLVLFFGVLYHLKSPLTGLESALYLAKETCLIETAIAPPEFSPGQPALAYLPGYAGDPTNYFYPNTEWIMKVCNGAGFTCDCIYYMPGRATYKAVRRVPK